MIPTAYVALIFGKQIILHKSTLGSIVEYANGATCYSCEIAPISEFEIVCEL